MKTLCDNPEYEEVFQNLCQLRPVRTTDRKRDLVKLTQIEKSFIIQSVARNGTSSLLKNLAQIKNGDYVDCYEFRSFEKCREYSRTGKAKLIIYDEAIKYLGKHCPEGVSFFEELAKEKQVGLRIHPKIDKRILDGFVSNGFELFNLEQISLEEYKELVDSKFREIGIKIPDEIIVEANSRFNALCPSNRFIACYFQTMIEEPEKLFIDYVLKKTRSINRWIFDEALIKR